MNNINCQCYVKLINQLDNTLQNNWCAIIGVSNHVYDTIKAKKNPQFCIEHLYDTKALHKQNITDKEKDLLNATLYILCCENAQINKDDDPENYINIKCPCNSADFAILKDIFSISPTTDIFQKCLDYLAKNKKSDDLCVKYNESLFCHFNKKDNERFELWKNIIHIFLNGEKKECITT